MPGRNVPLVIGEYYHIYNRGTNRNNVYTQTRDFKRFVQTLFYYQFLGPKPSFSKYAKEKLSPFNPLNENKLVEIICYCLMPNHFHLLVKQLRENGISIFMSQISNSYTKYFNTKYHGVGSVFQGTFKSKLVESDEQLLHLSRYIHLNPIVSYLVKDLEQYPWSSYSEYLNNYPGFCKKEEILNFFKSRNQYKQFLEDQIAYGTSLELLKHQAIDIEL